MPRKPDLELLLLALHFADVSQARTSKIRKMASQLSKAHKVNDVDFDRMRPGVSCQEREDAAKKSKELYPMSSHTTASPFPPSFPFACLFWGAYFTLFFSPTYSRLLEKRGDERWGKDPKYIAYKKRVAVLFPYVH